MEELLAKLIIEAEKESIKLTKLIAFKKTSIYEMLTDVEKSMLDEQQEGMERYQKALKSRIEYYKSKNVTIGTTKGEEIIGRFNPGNLQAVDEIKLCAIDMINVIEANKEADPRRKAKAYTDIETAQMFAVKSLFQ